MARRLTISLTADDEDRLRAAARQDESLGGTIRRMLSLGYFVDEARRDGKAIYVEGEDGRPERVRFVD